MFWCLSRSVPLLQTPTFLLVSYRHVTLCGCFTDEVSKSVSNKNDKRVGKSVTRTTDVSDSDGITSLAQQ